MTPHKHAEIIKAWADGAEIEVRVCPDRPWKAAYCPVFLDDCEYRVKLKWQKEYDAWRAGKTIQFKSLHGAFPWANEAHVDELGSCDIDMLRAMRQPEYEWRIKPEPIVEYRYARADRALSVSYWSIYKAGPDNIKATFTDGKLTAMEML